MRKVFAIIMLVAACVFMTGGQALAKDNGKTEKVVYSLNPAPVCQNCVNKIQGNLRFEKGVKDIAVDLNTKSVTITYSADKTDKEKLSAALKKIGYEATEGGAQAAGACTGCKAEKQGCKSEKQECKAEKQGCKSEKQECKAEKKSCCKTDTVAACH